MYGMKEGSEKTFGKGYNILPIFKERLNAKTLITTPNPDVIYALGYLDFKEDGPMVIEVPPGLQGILDDFWQRPIPSEGQIEGRDWSGDVGLPGPDAGKGGKYLILPAWTTGVTFRRVISPIARALTASSFSGAVSSRIRNSSRSLWRFWSRPVSIRWESRRPQSRCSFLTRRAWP